jgi:hypothetical protein
MKNTVLALLSLTIGLSAFAAAGFSSLEEQMTGKEFSAAGLDKLSKSELDALNEWIRKHSLATLDSPATAVAAGTVEEDAEDKGKDKDKKKDPTTVTSKLVGKFSGWDGQTVFKLENGMIWAQADKDKFHTKEIENPTVIIERSMFGTWTLRIDGYDADCRVKQIQ